MTQTTTKTFDHTNLAAKDRPAPDKQQGPHLTKKPVATGYTQNLSRVKVKQDDLIMFMNQLSIMLDSGVVISDALDAIAENNNKGSVVLSKIITDISASIKSGENFSGTLLNYPKVFNPMFVSMVKASEASGTMVEMLTVLCGYLTFESETRKRIKGALTYPLIMAIMAIAATGTLMFFVLPRFMKIYESRGSALPKLTQLLVNLSNVISDLSTMTLILTTMVFLGFGFYYWAGTLTGRRVIDYIKLRIPVLGTMFVDTVVTRSMRIMATMLNTGVSLLDAIEIIHDSCENFYFQKLWSETDERIRGGYQLSEAIELSSGSELIAPGIIQMLRAGEKSGKIGEVSDKISVFYEKKLEASIQNVMTLIEPVMIVILGGIIGTLAIALLLPVFKVSSVMAH